MNAARASELTPTEAAMSQAVVQVYSDVQRMMAETDARRQDIEDHRSRRRNRNRLMVLAVGLTMATVFPMAMAQLGVGLTMLRWTTALAFVAEACETVYAYFRRY